MDNKRKILQIIIRPSTQLVLNEMCEYYGMNRATLVRYAISDLYNNRFRKEVYGYQAGIATASHRLKKAKIKDAQSDKRDAMLAMDDESLSAYLIEIGYSPADEIKSDGTEIKYRVITNINGRYYAQAEHNDKNGYSYDRIIFTMDELFGDLKKEKKL